MPVLDWSPGASYIMIWPTSIGGIFWWPGSGLLSLGSSSVFFFFLMLLAFTFLVNFDLSCCAGRFQAFDTTSPCLIFLHIPSLRRTPLSPRCLVPLVWLLLISFHLLVLLDGDLVVLVRRSGVGHHVGFPMEVVLLTENVSCPSHLASCWYLFPLGLVPD